MRYFADYTVFCPVHPFGFGDDFESRIVPAIGVEVYGEGYRKIPVSSPNQLKFLPGGNCCSTINDLRYYPST